MVVSPTGHVLRSEINGTFKMKSCLSGMPEVEVPAAGCPPLGAPTQKSTFQLSPAELGHAFGDVISEGTMMVVKNLKQRGHRIG